MSDYLKANTNTEKCGSITQNMGWTDNVMSCSNFTWMYLAFGKNYFWTINPADYRWPAQWIYLDDYGSLTGLYNASSVGGGSLCGVVPMFYISPAIKILGLGTNDAPYVVCNIDNK